MAAVSPLATSSSKIRGYETNKFLVIFITALFSVFQLMKASLAMQTVTLLSFPAPRFSVVIDAGSTGTRIHVFRFDCDHSDEQKMTGSTALGRHCKMLSVDGDDTPSSYFAQIEGGLSLHANEPTGVRHGLSSLIQKAASLFPYRSDIKAFLGATAGLRFLPSAAQEGILREAQAVIDDEFPNAQGIVKVIDGNDEAKYQWRMVAFLTENPGVVVVDMGGGSVQLAYRTLQGPTHNSHHKFLEKMTDGSFLFLHSWLGYGFKAVRMRILEPINGQQSHCLLEPKPYLYTYADKSVTVTGIADSANTLRYEKCEESVKAAMRIGQGCEAGIKPCGFDGGWRGPHTIHSAPIYLFSHIFDMAVRLGLASKHRGRADLVIADLINEAKRACRSHNKSEYIAPPLIDQLAGDVSAPNASAIRSGFVTQVTQEDEDFFCLDAVFVAVFLEQGLGLPVDQRVTVANRLYKNGEHFEASWPLGAALAHHQEL